MTAGRVVDSKGWSNPLPSIGLAVALVKGWAVVTAHPSIIEETKRKLTLYRHKAGGGIEAFPVYKGHIKPDHLLVPRALAEGRCEIRGVWEALRPHTTRIEGYRDGQSELITEFMDGISSTFGRILKAPTGTGKTFMAIDIMFRLGYKTLIIVPVSSLIDDERNGWIAKLLKFTTLKREDIGVIRQNRCEYEGKKVCIALIHSLVAREGKYPEPFYSSFGTVVFDEVHTLGAETFSRTAPMFHSRFRVGLSATPRRKDGMDNVFYWHIGRLCGSFHGKSISPKVVVLVYHGAGASQVGCMWGGKLNLGRYLNRLSADDTRNRFIATQVLTLWKAGKDTLVLSDRKALLNQVRHHLKGAIPDSQVGMYVHGDKNPDKKILLGTYGSCGMGVDLPRLSALILATPRVDVEQAVGRVMRSASPIVVDIVDGASPLMVAWSKARVRRFYGKVTRDIHYR